MLYAPDLFQVQKKELSSHSTSRNPYFISYNTVPFDRGWRTSNTKVRKDLKMKL